MVTAGKTSASRCCLSTSIASSSSTTRTAIPSATACRHVADRAPPVRPEHARLAAMSSRAHSITEPADGADAAQHLLREFVEPVPVRGMTFDLGASIGLRCSLTTPAPFTNSSPTPIWRCSPQKRTARVASSALSQRWPRVRDQLSVATTFDSQSSGRTFASYQPIVNIETGQWQGVEA